MSWLKLAQATRMLLVVVLYWFPHELETIPEIALEAE